MTDGPPLTPGYASSELLVGGVRDVARVGVATASKRSKSFAIAACIGRRTRIACR